jgi:epoxyqueuosine reductase
LGVRYTFITKEQGSWFFIGEIITDLELDYDNKTIPNHCGGCTRCIDTCPTQALDKNGLDARKCISYLTIEYRGDHLPAKSRKNMEDWIFGCDICQDVCPWNRLSEPHNQPEFDPPGELRKMNKNMWENMTESQFRVLFKNSPVKRTKYKGLKRNITFIAEDQEKK